MPTMKSTFTLLSALAVSTLLAGNLKAEGYQHSLTVDKMTFDWSVKGDQLAVKLAAPTTGWVAIGFNPTEKMKGANIIIGYVKDGKVEISDDFGTTAIRHAADTSQNGKENVTIVGGSEQGSTTTLEFSLPLHSEEATDGTTIDPNADTVIILAYGPDMDSFKTKHKYDKTITVNLGSGVMK